jgi:hypothetical protein
MYLKNSEEQCLTLYLIKQKGVLQESNWNPDVMIVTGEQRKKEKQNHHWQ